MAARRSFVIRLVKESRAPAIRDFHRQYLTEHLWPRTTDEFKKLAEEECLYEAIELVDGTDRLVGVCYIQYGSEPEKPKTERSEFGGVFVVDDCRGLSLATALGMVAISNHFAWATPHGRLVAHVHEDNPLPRGMLKDQLGFVHNGEEIPPADVAPANMKRNAQGQVVGHLFEFKRGALLSFADWIEGFGGTIKGKKGESTLRVDLRLMELRADTITALRDLGKSQ